MLMVWFVFVCLLATFCSGDDDGPFFEIHYHKRSINEAALFATTTDPASVPRKNQMLLVFGGVHSNSSLLGGYDYINQFFGLINGHTWVPKSPLPYKKEWGTLSQGPEGKVIVAGGGVGVHYTNDTYLYDVSENRWEIGPTLNTPRGGHCSVSLGSQVFIIGGFAKDGYNLNSVEVWDWGKGKSSEWENITPMETARFGPSATIYRGDLYVVGGKRLKSAEKYVFLLKIWKDIPNMIHDRYLHSLVTLNNKIYAVGGYNFNSSTVLKSVESFNGRKWVEEAPLNTGRYGAASGVIGGKIYVVGGATTHEELVFDIEVYDPSTSTWSLVDFTGTSPLPVFQNGAVVVDLP